MSVTVYQDKEKDNIITSLINIEEQLKQSDDIFDFTNLTTDKASYLVTINEIKSSQQNPFCFTVSIGDKEYFVYNR